MELDDSAPAPLPDAGPLVSGTFQPTNAAGAVDTFVPPAPAPSGNSLLSIFTGQDPNGQWELIRMDAAGNGPGSIQSWTIEITAKVKEKKRKKK